MNLKLYSQFKAFAKVFMISLLFSAVFTSYIYWASNDLNSRIIKIFSKMKDRKEEIFVPPSLVEVSEIRFRLNLTNPGHLGKPVVLHGKLTDIMQKEVNKSYDEFKFNEFVSRLIPLDRELPDFRRDACKAVNYSSNLPKVSVVLAFYNEPFSMVMRTIYSILNRSPAELIDEIILVDDCSDKSESMLGDFHSNRFLVSSF